MGLDFTSRSEILAIPPKGEWKSSDGTCLESGTECTLLGVTAGSFKVFSSIFLSHLFFVDTTVRRLLA